MKITGAEFKEWHDTAWPEGFVWADDSVLADGRELYAEDGDAFTVLPTEVFSIPAEWCVIPDDCKGDGHSIRSLIRKWQKGKSTMVMAIEIPREREEELRAYLTSLNLRIVA